MTACIHHGPPGSYKSFGTIQRVVIPALKQGRTLVTNIRGLDSLKRIEDAIGEKLHPEAQIIHVEADSSKGFNAMSHFFHWVPKGALIVMDEFQRVYSKKRDRDLKKYDLHLTFDNGEPRSDDEVKKLCPWWDGDRDRPETVENAFDQHRHYNWDIYCTTPNIAKVHPEAREVAEIAYRHKALGALLPWKKHSWKEFTHDPESSGKQFSHYMGSPKEYKANQTIFACYQSTKTGKAFGSSESRPIYRDPKLQMVALGVVGCLVWFVISAVKAVENGSLVGISTEKANAYLESNLTPVPVGGGGNVGDIGADQGRSAPAAPVVKESSGSIDQFKALEARFQGYTRPDPREVVDPFGSLIDQGASAYVSAIVSVPATGKLYYRLEVYAGSRLVDVFDHLEMAELGYKASSKALGLYLEKNGHKTLYRERYGSAGGIREEPMGRAGSAGAAVTSL
ncbi:hypothetical protein KQ940_13215 [Marinobacterium sp. D7]|uniref:zonular occludens toxin family protein n=1 Tax=Marinobacterium ramblicola TaxID=2849041 RepID=UPI001C2D6FF6|nr:zonular occludens toxin domain-containing protein [Marinobacterium ramblicola]MBV1789011.1 hypothetical protein [Marinobacterium ramblicola]